MTAEEHHQQLLECKHQEEGMPINEIAAALAKAQMEMRNPGFDSANPHFRSKFASLASVRDTVVPVLAKHGISVVQDLKTTERGTECTTILVHASGQSMTFGPLMMPASKQDAQGYGSAATYSRRYALMAAVCVVGDDDDDANAATGKPAYSESHRPAGDIPKQVDQTLARKTANEMRAVLAEDLPEDARAAAVYEAHTELNRNNELYIAASALLDSKERSAWKAYIKQAKDQVNVMANGRAA